MRVDFEEGVRVLKAGSPLVFPTDTVMGIGLSPLDAGSLEALYEVKARDHGKPIAWLVGDRSELGRLGADVSGYAWRLAEAFWPGALTLVMKASDAVPAAFRSGQGTIGLRMPSHAGVLALIDALGAPLAVTSANPSGSPAPTCIDGLDVSIVEACAVLDAADALSSDDAEHDANHDAREPSPLHALASTVVDCTGPAPAVLRAGTIAIPDIEAVLAGLVD